MDINSLYNITSGAVANAVKTSGVGVKPTESEESSFSSFLNTAIENISTTNAYLSDAENEEEIERAIDEIIQYDFMNIYKKVRKSDTKSV